MGKTLIYNKLLILIGFFQLNPVSAQVVDNYRTGHISIDKFGAITRMDTSVPKIYLVFTAHEYGEGGKYILKTLKKKGAKASFFLTGDFLRNRSFRKIIRKIISQGHYIGPHSDRHLLYCDWENRDSLFVTHPQFQLDLKNNLEAISSFGITRKSIPYFMPPYEWYNQIIVNWTREMDMKLINYTPGTLSHADYTTPDMPNYRGSKQLYQSILDFEKKSDNGLNGFLLLIHMGTHPNRTDKLYLYLDQLITELGFQGYQFVKL